MEYTLKCSRYKHSTIPYRRAAADRQREQRLPRWSESHRDQDCRTRACQSISKNKDFMLIWPIHVIILKLAVWCNFGNSMHIYIPRLGHPIHLLCWTQGTTRPYRARLPQLSIVVVSVVSYIVVCLCSVCCAFENIHEQVSILKQIYYLVLRKAQLLITTIARHQYHAKQCHTSSGCSVSWKVRLAADSRGTCCYS